MIFIEMTLIQNFFRWNYGFLLDLSWWELFVYFNTTIFSPNWWIRQKTTYLKITFKPFSSNQLLFSFNQHQKGIINDFFKIQIGLYSYISNLNFHNPLTHCGFLTFPSILVTTASDEMNGKLHLTFSNFLWRKIKQL